MTIYKGVEIDLFGIFANLRSQIVTSRYDSLVPFGILEKRGLG